MNERGDADCAFEIRNGVKVYRFHNLCYVNYIGRCFLVILWYGFLTFDSS
jgi:hypothetical protein